MFALENVVSANVKRLAGMWHLDACALQLRPQPLHQVVARRWPDGRSWRSQRDR